MSQNLQNSVAEYSDSEPTRKRPRAQSMPAPAVDDSEDLIDLTAEDGYDDDGHEEDDHGEDEEPTAVADSSDDDDDLNMKVAISQIEKLALGKAPKIVFLLRSAVLANSESTADQTTPSTYANPFTVNDPAFKACTICMEDYSDDDRVSYLPCNHVFGSKCLFSWLVDDIHQTCPTCNSPATPDDIKFLHGG